MPLPDVLAPNFYLGTMGFAYKQWQGPFYPAGMAARHFLRHYSGRFNAVEIDATFYGPPRPSQVMRWAQTTPTHFRFCLKTPRAITHDAPIKNGMAAMGSFVETAQLLGEKLAVILLQFGPAFTRAERGDLAAFLAQLPAGSRYAIEFRHNSWLEEDTAGLLREHGVAWVAADYIHLPPQVQHTANFLYLRFIGPHGRYQTKDRELEDKTADLQAWRRRLQPHLTHVDAVYGFFNNDYSGYSPATCNRFQEILGLETKEIRAYRQGRLF